MSQRVIKQRGWGRGALSWLFLATGIAAANACIPDVEIPDCISDHSCGPGGSAGAAGSAGTVGAAGSTSASGSSSGGVSGAGSGTGDGGTGEGGAGAGEGGAGEGGAGGEGGCETCRLTPAELVAPCATKPYEVGLVASGGRAPYAWQLIGAPAGWTIARDPGQPDRARLIGDAVARGETELEIRVVDADGLVFFKTYRTTAREACWFAYTARTSGGSRLALRDALSEAAELAPLQHDGDVYDFQFSPDGQYLVYRYGADDEYPRGRHLSLVRLSTLEETALTFGEDAVRAYAWSPGSAALAVGFETDGETFLGGARFDEGDAPTLLASVPAFVEQSLVWVGDEGVAFDAAVLIDEDNPETPLPNEDLERTGFYSALQPSSFGEPKYTLDIFTPTTILLPSARGFWVLDGALPSFFPTTGVGAGPELTQGAYHHQVQLISPSGNYSARKEGTALDLFAAEVGTRITLATIPPGQCDVPLAWSAQDRLACVVDVDNGVGLGSHGEVRLFGFDQAGQVTGTTLDGFCEDDTSWSGAGSCTSKRQKYGYGEELAIGSPREFSGSGQWLAFSRPVANSAAVEPTAPTSAYVYVAKVSASAPSVTKLLFFSGLGSATRLAFSPDEQKLAVQLGSTLVVQPLLGTQTDLRVTSALVPAETCSEDLPTAPGRYCGNTSRDSLFKWSPDSRALAHRSGDTVAVAEVSHSSGPIEIALPLPSCNPPLCSGGFEFQPSPKR